MNTDTLLIANAFVSGDAIIARKSTQQFDLEMFDRLINIPLASSKYALIESGSLPATVLFPHTNDHLQRLIHAMQPNGRLLIHEPVLLKALGAIPPVTTTLPGLPRRTADELLTALTLSGYLRPTVLASIQLGERELLAYLRGWGASEDIVNSMASQLIGCVAVLQVEAWKPSYEVGATSSLKLRKRTNVAAAVQPQHDTQQSQVKSVGGGVWQVSLADDDTQDLIDEETLLDEEDRLQRPNAESLQRPSGGDCSAKKRACKNCSCGRAELEAKQAADGSGVKIVSTENVKSSCGSCYLGDAFRCSSCPYLGMPAFKPGEQIQLPTNFLE